MAIKALAWMVRAFDEPVYCYHEIVHNKLVVERFEAQGVVFVDDIDDVPDGAPLMLSAHGSAPDIAGRGIGNPVALMNSAAMLLEWLGARHGRDDLIGAATRFNAAIDRVLEDPVHHTPDLGGSAKTADVGDAVAAAITG